MVTKSVLAKHVHITDSSELAGKPMSLEEGEVFVSTMAPKHTFLSSEKGEIKDPTGKEKFKEDSLGSVLLAVDDKGALDLP